MHPVSEKLNDGSPSPSSSPSPQSPFPFKYPFFPTAGQAKFYPLEAGEFCFVKSVISGVMGGGLGVVMSFIGWGFNSGSMTSTIHTPAYYDLSTKQQLKASFNELATSAKRNSKDFAKIGAVYSLTECIIEKKEGDRILKTLSWLVVSPGLLLEGIPRRRPSWDVLVSPLSPERLNIICRNDWMATLSGTKICVGRVGRLSDSQFDHQQKEHTFKSEYY